MPIIIEHSAKIEATLPERDVNKKMEVFYNPLMSSNRNISVILLNSVENKKMGIALPLAGSGIRALRFLQELKKGKIERLSVNDKKENFVKTFQDNLKLNKISKTNSSKVTIKNEDAEKFMLTQHADEFCGYFDYIDIDPFGTPNPFLSFAVAKIKRNGILAITATDTAALTGTYPKVTKRKYWSTSLKNYMMHEIGLRILIRKVQLQGIQFDKALIPILSYHKGHYFRIYFRSEKGKQKCDDLIKNHQYLLFCPKCLNFKLSNYNSGDCECKNEFQFAGPLWAGNLFDKKLVNKMAKNNHFPEEQKFLNTLKEEASCDIVGYYDLHAIAKAYKRDIPKMDLTLKKIKAVRTHFSPNGIKTEASVCEIIKLL
jgi:tRNA (guanine26-N2/guanine27-N2)-dimethyltransferase